LEQHPALKNTYSSNVMKLQAIFVVGTMKTGLVA
jgi:hypothetical protein